MGFDSTEALKSWQRTAEKHPRVHAESSFAPPQTKSIGFHERYFVIGRRGGTRALELAAFLEVSLRPNKIKEHNNKRVQFGPESRRDWRARPQSAEIGRAIAESVCIKLDGLPQVKRACAWPSGADSIHELDGRRVTFCLICSQ
jgi:hypothetical protein